MLKESLYYAKILLFGEYGIIEDSMGLSIPYTFFKGKFEFATQPTDVQLASNQSIAKFVNHLQEMSLKNELPCEFNFGKLNQDIQNGLYFDSSIPQGFGVGSSEQKPSENISYPNFNAGWIMYNSKFYLGFAAHNITEPNWSFYKNPDEVLPRRYTVHAGGVIKISKSRYEENTFSPNALFMMQRNFTQLNLGFYANKGPLVTGLWFRQTFGNYKNSDAIIMLVGFRKDRFKFGYSYDFTVSDGRSAIPASHEVSATIDWCVPPGGKPFKPIKCPEF